jgi:hypothetical protein
MAAQVVDVGVVMRGVESEVVRVWVKEVSCVGVSVRLWWGQRDKH